MPSYLQDSSLMLLAFVAVAGLIGVVSLLLSGRKDPLEQRLEELKAEKAGAGEFLEEDLFADEGSRGILAYIFPFINESSRRKMGDRLIQAGLYQRNSIGVYVFTRLLLLTVPIGIAIAGWILGLATGLQAGLLAAITAILATIAPGFYLDFQRKGRQQALKRALPDALDVVIVCIEGGLSLPAAFAKVASELNTAHPLLAMEMSIVEREIQVGRSTGEALKNFAQRFDLDELRGLASVVLQAEKFGSSVVRAMRVHADALREKRMMDAEERANQATVKLLIPTLLFIFPALFVVVMGPAAIDIYYFFEDLQLNMPSQTP